MKELLRPVEVTRTIVRGLAKKVRGALDAARLAMNVASQVPMGKVRNSWVLPDAQDLIDINRNRSHPGSIGSMRISPAAWSPDLL